MKYPCFACGRSPQWSSTALEKRDQARREQPTHVTVVKREGPAMRIDFMKPRKPDDLTVLGKVVTVGVSPLGITDQVAAATDRRTDKIRRLATRTRSPRWRAWRLYESHTFCHEIARPSRSLSRIDRPSTGRLVWGSRPSSQSQCQDTPDGPPRMGNSGIKSRTAPSRQDSLPRIPP